MSFSRPIRLSREHLFLGLCLAARLALGLAYSQIVPPWESYDEPGHFQYARYLAKYHRLLQPGDPEAESIWSKFQPPLYYVLIAPALLPFDLGAQLPPLMLNPFLANGNAGVNYAVTPDVPVGLEGQLTAALRAGRAWSGVLSALSLVWVYAAARRLWPRAPALAQAAALMYAFWPQFIFIGDMLTNDLLVTSLAAPLLYLVIKGLQEGWRARDLAALSLIVGAALLTKLNGAALIPITLVPLVRLIRTRWNRKLALMAAGLGVIVIVALAGLSQMPFVTGQVFQFGTVQRFVSNLLALPTQPAQASALLQGFSYGFWTFFASYGWGNLETFSALYGLWLLGALAAAIGLSVGRRRPFSRGIGWTLTLMPFSLVTLATALSIAESNTLLMVGRYWLPALPAVCLLLVGGWQALTPARWGTWPLRAAAGVLIGASWATVFAILAPAYAKPQPMTPAQSAQLEPGTSAEFGDGQVRLLGYVRPQPSRPDASARLTVCWEAGQPLTANYPVQLEVIGPDGQGYGARSTYAGGGNYPTRLWEPGRPFCDTYETTVWDTFPAPAVGVLRVRLQTEVNGRGLEATGPAGAALGDGVSVPLIVHAVQPPAAPGQTVQYQFGADLKLIGYAVAPLTTGDGLRVKLWWQAQRALDTNYQVYVHLRDTPQSAYVQSDAAPRDGHYPTSAWTAGEVVLDEHDLRWPQPGTPPALKLFVGVYRASDQTRLAVTDAQGQTLANNELELPLP